MPKQKRRPPDLLEVTRTDGTLVMDCNSGIALLVIRPSHAETGASQEPAGEEPDAELTLSPKPKLTRN